MDAHLKDTLQMPHAGAWLSGSHLGGSSDSRSPSPSRTALREMRIGGAVGTSVTSVSDLSSSASTLPCRQMDALRDATRGEPGQGSSAAVRATPW